MQSRMEGCSCYSDAPVTRIVLDDRGVVVGIVGLKQIFEQLYLLGCTPEGVEVAEELLAMVKTCNYVAPAVEEQYKSALLREYTAFYTSQEE